MNIEEKAKRYDEIIKKANKMHNENCEACKVCLEELIPELVESEDERIRKELLNHLKKASYGKTLVVNTLDYKRWADWLEKQGEQKLMNEKSLYKAGYLDGFEDGVRDAIIKENEQKPTDKVEPKFKVGDKIYLKPEYRMPDDDTPIANTVFEIRAIDGKHYRFDGSYIFIEDQDKYELVEQKPANKSDVLMSLDEAIAHCKEKSCGDNACALEHKQLEKWLTELKELKGQKPAEWGEEDRQTLHLIIDDLSEELNDEPDEADKEILCRKISFLNSLKPQPIHKWDREDNKVKLEITNYLECQKREEPTRTDILNKWIAWIANLGPQWKQKPAWSEDDEMFVHGLIRGLTAKRDIHGHTTFSSDCIDITETINWLKSLKDIYTWKPSDEQMEALNDVISSRDIKYDVLSELWEQLKKLREE